MKIATLLFVYNRSSHTEQVISSLKQNTVLPYKLFVFQDGLKDGEDADEWIKVSDLIRNIDWCEKEIIVSKYNKGLAESIVSGINYAFKEYDAIIVLEDDCVPTTNFISFMQQCFEKYQDDKRVYCVSGYSWPITLEQGMYDVYGCGRISSWGWGTWKDRWGIYDKNFDIVKRLKNGQVTSQNLAIWGRDLENILVGNMKGECDSWAVFWALNVIAREGICINPYQSMIRNIGMDGTGRHCGVTDWFEVKCIDEEKKNFSLPDKINISEETQKAFAPLYGSFTAANVQDSLREKILVYGAGYFYQENERAINEIYYINAFVDKRKKGWLDGKKIISLKEIGQYTYDRILIMVKDIQACINITKELTALGIGREKILLGHSFFGSCKEGLDNISISEDGKGLSITVDEKRIKVKSIDELNNAREVLVNHTYHYFVNNGRRDLVLDVGLNVGAASLYFLQNENIEKVYAYEPFKETYLAARDNLQGYLQNKEKIEIFQYGISNVNDTRLVGFNRNMTCGQSTISDVREEVYRRYRAMGLVEAGDEEKEMIEVRDAAEVFLPIIQNHPDCNIILKLDCEGEEYGIIERLFQKGILSRITFIMMEWHYRGKDSILKYLKEAGFSYWCSNKSEDMGLIYGCKI